MLTNTGFPALKPDIDINNFLKEAERLFAADAWLQELIQNALRAGATRLEFLREGSDLVVVENGRGFETNDWAKLFCISRTGWDDTIKKKQNPAGMGLYSALLRFPLCIESNGIQVSTTPAGIKARDEITPKEIPTPAGGSKTTLIGGWPAFIGALDLFSSDILGVHRLKSGKILTITPWEDLEQAIPELKKDTDFLYARILRRVSGLFGAALFNSKHERVSLSIPALRVDTPIAELPGSNKYDPTVEQTLVVSTHEIVNGKMKLGQHNYPAPRLKTEDMFITLTEESQPRPRHEESRWIKIIFHGQYVSVRLTDDRLLAALDIDPVVHIYGKSCLRIRHPDRTHVVENAAWKQFQSDFIVPLFQQWKAMREKIANPGGIPMLHICDKATAFDASVGCLFYYNPNLNDGKHTRNSVSYALAHEPDLAAHFKNGYWQKTPALYKKLDAIVDLAVEVDDYADQTTNPSNISRLINLLAAEGQIAVGQVDHSTSTADFGELQHLYKEVDAFTVSFGTELGSDKMTPKQGGHKIVWVSEIRLAVDDGRSWKTQEPVIMAAHNLRAMERNFEHITFYANPAYRELLKQDPQEAYLRFSNAIDDLWKENVDECFTHTEFEEAEPAYKARSFFHKKTVRSEFEESVSRFLAEQNTDWNQKAYQGQVHVKHVRLDNERFELRATLEFDEGAIKADIEGDKVNFTVITRQKR